MSNPRIFQGWPLTEVPLAWLEQRYETDRIKRENAAEVAPGVFVQVMAHGDFFMPDGRVTGGARIAVWDERVPAEISSLQDAHRQHWIHGEPVIGCSSCEAIDPGTWRERYADTH